MQSGSGPLSVTAAGTAVPRDHNVDKRRLLIVIALLLWSFLLTYIFHVVLNLGTLFTRFFNIPIVLSTFCQVPVHVRTHERWRCRFWAHAFETGRNKVYQALLAKPQRGKSGLPLTRADWYRCMMDVA